MIKSLRKRFIFAAMASTFGVLFVIMSILNVANYVRMVSRADDTLDELADNNGQFDSRDFMKELMPDHKDGQLPSNSGESDGNAVTKQDESENIQPPEKLGKKRGDKFSPETPFQTRFFSVVVLDGIVVSYSLDNIAAVNESDAESYAEQIIADGIDKGFIDIYRYMVVDCDDETGGSRIIFVDCRQEIESFKNTLVYSVGVSLLGFLAVFTLVLFWSKKIFKPVADSYEKQKRFITDASHEIKTPLTIIDANTEVIEMVRDHFSTLSEVRGKKINADIEDGIKYTGDENSIRQLISILVDNAMKYAVETTPIDISMRRDGRKVRFMLRNLTDGMDEGSQDILFERFYRPDSSRNSETGGSGIGLSLAKSIVEAHKGKITAKCDKDGYITFQVTL